jgi:hypothetical protein
VTIQQLKAVYQAQPFRPFVMHLADGRQMPVMHRELIMSSPSGRTVAVYLADDTVHIVDLLLVTDLELRQTGNGSSRRRRR